MSSRPVGVLSPDVKALNLPVVKDDARAFKAILQGLDAVVDVPLASVVGLEDNIKFDRLREWR